MNTIEKIAGRALTGGELEELFLSYFNNRMTVLLMMIEHPGIKRSAQSVQRQRFFLEDLYHHFLPTGCAAKYRRAFEWLFRFLNIFPDIPPRRTYTALRMVGLIYETFGLELPLRDEAVRLEREEMFEGRRRGAV